MLLPFSGDKVAVVSCQPTRVKGGHHMLPVFVRTRFLARWWHVVTAEL